MKPLKKLFGFFCSRSFLTFLIIGGVNTALSYLFSYALAQWAGWGLLPSTALPYAVLSVPSFILNRRFSFKSAAPLLPSALRFATIIAVCFFFSFSLNHLAAPWLRAEVFPQMSGQLYTLVRLFGIQVVFTLLNYAGQRLWAFKN